MMVLPPPDVERDELENSEEAHLAAWVAWHRWDNCALPHQKVPPGDWWSIWLLLAGRGAGKTRTAAETMRDWAWMMPGTRGLVAAPTFGDLERVCFEGESGLLAVIPPAMIAKYNSQDLELLLVNGSLLQGITAEKPERFRGPQFHFGWCDELAAWARLQEAWDLMQFGMRLGERPRIICTTTPKPKPLIRDLLRRSGKDVVVTRASTYDNIANLAPTFREAVLKYEGTVLGRQEIHAEVIDPSEAGIIKRSWFRMWPAGQPLPVLSYIVLSLDTAFTEEARDKKTGDTDYTACTVWGLFWTHEKDPDGKIRKDWGILLLDCWQERLGFPDLVKRTKREITVKYGEDDKAAVIKPLFGPRKTADLGRQVDRLIIEDKGSGISLTQTLNAEGIEVWRYNPGRTKKLDRLHMVSHVFAQGHVWVLESTKTPGEFVSWADEKGSADMPDGLLDQLTMFSGEGSLRHDDFVDSATQAIRYIVDHHIGSVTEPDFDRDDYPQPEEELANPYAA